MLRAFRIQPGVSSALKPMSFPFMRNEMREKCFGEGTRKLVGERM